MIVNLKTGRKGKGAICYKWTMATKLRPTELGPRSAHTPGCLQGSSAAVPYPSTQGKFTALQGVLLSLASLLQASLTFSCAGTFLLSVPDRSSVTNYPCRAATSRIFPALTKPVISLTLNTYEIVTMWKGKREGRMKRSFWLRFAEKLLEEVNTQDEAKEAAAQKWSGLH